MARIISGGGAFRPDLPSTQSAPMKGNPLGEFDTFATGLTKVLDLSGRLLTDPTIGAIIGGIGRATSPSEDEEVLAEVVKARSEPSNRMDVAASNGTQSVDSIVEALVGNTAGKKALTQKPSSKEYSAPSLTKTMVKAGATVNPPQAEQLEGSFSPDRTRIVQETLDAIPSTPAMTEMPVSPGGFTFEQLRAMDEQDRPIKRGTPMAKLMSMAMSARSPTEAHKILLAVQFAPDVQPRNAMEAINGEHIIRAQQRLADILESRLDSIGKRDITSEYAAYARAQAALQRAETDRLYKGVQSQSAAVRDDLTRARMAKTLGPDWQLEEARRAFVEARMARRYGVGKGGRKSDDSLTKEELSQLDKLIASEEASGKSDAQIAQDLYEQADRAKKESESLVIIDVDSLRKKPFLKTGQFGDAQPDYAALTRAVKEAEERNLEAVANKAALDAYAAALKAMAKTHAAKAAESRSFVGKARTASPKDRKKLVKDRVGTVVPAGPSLLDTVKGWLSNPQSSSPTTVDDSDL